MIEQLKRQLIGAWWVIIIISLSLIIFGGVSLAMPAVTLTVLMTVLAILIIVWGLSQLVRGLQVADGQAKAFLVVAGALLILLGAVMLANPRVSVATLSFVLGWVVMLRSLIDLILSRIFPARSRTRALWLMSGVIGVVVSFVLWLFPVSSAQLFVQIVGGYALVNGIILLANAIELRRTVRRRMPGYRTANKPIDRGEVIDL
jgi:putative membrane protein